MSEPTKYYDYSTNRPIDMDSQGCELSEWYLLYRKCRFARHPRGFKIFLPPQKLAVDDEYANSDPYTLSQNVGGEFHTRRIDLTLSLVNEAITLTGRTAPQILDLGCGQGHITERIFQSLKDAQVSGLDYSVSAIEYAHQHFPHIDFAVGDAYDSPYSPSFFDVIVCNNLWEHVPDPVFLLGRISRILRPNGYLIISTPSRYRTSNLIRVLKGNSVAFMSPKHVTEYTVGQVKEQLAYGGYHTRRVLSRPISSLGLRIAVAHALFTGFVSMIRSHHQMESTVFYLAQKVIDASSAEIPV